MKRLDDARYLYSFAIAIYLPSSVTPTHTHTLTYPQISSAHWSGVFFSLHPRATNEVDPFSSSASLVSPVSYLCHIYVIFVIIFMECLWNKNLGHC